MSQPVESGPEFVARVLARYRGLRSYVDEGSVRVRVRPDDDGTEIGFTTAWRAPDRFAFDFRVPHAFPPLRHLSTRHGVRLVERRACIWSEWQEGRVEVQEVPPQHVVGAATGVSSVAVATIACLLVPGLERLAIHLAQLREPRVEGSAVIDDVACLRLLATDVHDERHELWFESASSLLRRWVRQDGATIEERRAIVVDQPIDADRFAFPDPSQT